MPLALSFYASPSIPLHITWRGKAIYSGKVIYERNRCAFSICDRFRRIFPAHYYCYGQTQAKYACDIRPEPVGRLDFYWLGGRTRLVFSARKIDSMRKTRHWYVRRLGSCGMYRRVQPFLMGELGVSPRLIFFPFLGLGRGKGMVDCSQ